MATNTETLNLYKVDPIADGEQTFNITTMLNNNWDKIDLAVKDVRTALTETGIKIPAIYNVSGNGVQDDQPGLQGYINDSRANGKAIITIPKPAVRYNLGDQLLIENQEDMTLEGEGFGTLLFGVRMDKAPLKFLNCRKLRVRNLGLSSNDQNRVPSFQGALTLQYVEDFEIDGILVDRAAAAGFFITDSHNGTITRNWIRNTQADGIHHTSRTSGVVTTHNHLYNTGDDAISVVSDARTQDKPCFDILIAHNVVAKAGARGITNVGGTAVTIDANNIRETASSNILVLQDGSYGTYSPKGTIISNNIMHGAGLVTPVEGNQIGLEIGGSTATTITNNQISGATQRGMVVGASASQVKIEGNLVKECLSAGYAISGTYVEMNNNRAELNGEQGVLLLNLTWSTVDNVFALNNGTRYLTEPTTKYDNIFVSGCSDLLIDGVTTIDDRATVILDRGIELNGCSRIKISKWQIKVSTQTRPVFSGTNTEIEMDPFTQTTVPTQSTFPFNLFKNGQVIHVGAVSYRLAGSVWTAIADVSDVTAGANVAINTAATALTTHAGDASKHSYWGGQTTGDGTNVTNPAYMATVPGVQTTGALPDGFAVTVVLNVANGGGDPFLRINNCTNYPIRRNATTQFAGGTLKAGQLISLVKVGNYFLARSAAPTGNATPATVLAGSTFMSETSPDGAAGTVPILTGIRIATGVGLFGDRGLAVYPERGYQKGGTGDGEIKVLIDQLAAAEPNLIPANIRAGTNIFGKLGTLTEVKQFSQTYGYTNGVLTINFGFVPRIIGVSILKPDGFVRGAFLMASVDGRLETISTRDANNNPDVYLNPPFAQTVGMSIYNANQVKVMAFS